MTYRQGRFWQPDVTVATVVVDQGRLLCVEEHAGGALVLNQPAGHLEPDESLVEAAVRETLEESGCTVGLDAFIGAYQWTSPVLPDGSGGRHYLRFAFAGHLLSQDLARPLDQGIVRALWLTPAELRAQSARHRSPLVWQVVADHLAGSRQPLSLLRSVR
jgi:8-oxo-dGTP pyrophosphatase MutT (NUDIX family)